MVEKLRYEITNGKKQVLFGQKSISFAKIYNFVFFSAAIYRYFVIHGRTSIFQLQYTARKFDVHRRHSNDYIFNIVFKFLHQNVHR